MRMKLKILCSVLLIALLSVTLATTSAKQIGEGIVNIGTLDRGTGFDPADVFEMLSWEIMENIFDGLVTLDPVTGEVKAQLATDWSISEDNKTYTFTLRKGVTFHDGTPFNAEAVRFSLQRAAALGGPPGYLVGDFVDAENIEVIDDYTVKIPFKIPYADALKMFSIPIYSPVSPAAYPKDEFKFKQPVGTGPYKLTSWIKGSRIVLEANEDYWGPAPKNQKIVWKIYSKASNLKFALQNREVDMVWRELSLEDVDELVSSPNFDTSEGVGQIRFIVINTKAKPFDNVNIRKAIASAIDRKEIVRKVYLDLVPPLYSLLPAGLSESKPAFLEKYGDGAIEKAKVFLERAGYSEENPLEMEFWYTPAHYGALEDEVALVIKSQLERTNMIKVNLKSQEWATYIGRVAQGEMANPFLLGWGSAVFIPDWYTTNFLSKGGAKSMGSLYDNPEMIDLVQKQQKEFDTGKRTKFLADIQELTAEDVPYIPFAQRISRVVKWSDVKGVKLGPGFTFSFATIYKEE